MSLPDYLKIGDPARLFPVISETGKEQRAASIFLAVLSANPPLARELLNQVGQRTGSRTRVDTFTEVMFKGEVDAKKHDRPDGLIVVTTGKRVWTCLLETKIGKNVLNTDQIERYLRLAKDNNIDAVLTISNEFVATPTHHPLNVQKTLLRKISLFHFSWRSILIEAVLLQEQAAIKDPEQAFLLREFIRFFSHESAGITGFTSMPPEWSTAIDKVQAGGGVTKPEAAAIINAWHQEIRDLSLIMSRIISCRVTQKLSRAHIISPELRVSDDLKNLCDQARLEAAVDIPNAASTIDIIADLKNRSLRMQMSIKAPRDKARNASRLNWLLKQLKQTEMPNVFVAVGWAARPQPTVISLSKLKESFADVEKQANGSEITRFDITVTSDSARRFAGVRTFIEELEILAPRFYEEVGQHLESWQAPPPKPRHTMKAEKPLKEEIETESVTPLAQPTPEKSTPMRGNAHSDLLEIPSFLNRIFN